MNDDYVYVISLISVRGRYEWSIAAAVVVAQRQSTGGHTQLLCVFHKHVVTYVRTTLIVLICMHVYINRFVLHARVFS